MSPRAKNKLRKTLLILVSLTLFLLIVLYLINHQDRMLLLLKIKRHILVYLLICSLFASLTVAFGFRNLMIIFKVKLKTREWIGLSVTNSMYNYIVPFQGALLIRAQYLKAKYRFEYSKYAVLSGGALLIGLLTASFVSVILLLIKLIFTGFFYKNLFITVCSLFLIMAVISALVLIIDFKRFQTGWLWLDNIFFTLFSGIAFFKKNYSLLLVIIVTNLFLFLFMGLRLYYSFIAIGVPVGLLEVIVIQSISVFSMVLPIAPGYLGVREGLIGLTAVMLNLNIDDAVLAALVDRAIGMVTIFIAGAIYHFVLLKEMDFKEIKNT